jgi:hypothetical protein
MNHIAWPLFSGGSFSTQYVKTKAIAVSIVTALMFLLGGCAAPDQHPFDQYSTAVKSAGDSLDKVLVEETAWSRDEYIDKVLKGSVTLEDTALLDSKAGKFTVTFPAGGQNKPTFYTLQDVRVTLSSLNQATGKYVTVLATLASKELVNPDTFEAIAKDTDSSLNSIAKKLNVQNAEVGIHIFSVGSAEVMRLLIEHRRRAALEKILVDNQPAIDAYCGSCISLLRALDHSLAADYSAKAQQLEKKFVSMQDKTHGDLTEDSQAKAVVVEHLQLNSDYVALVQSLKSAKEVYTKLPQGHRELLQSVQKKATNFEAIQGLAEEGQRLKTIYDELQKPSSTSSKTP